MSTRDVSTRDGAIAPLVSVCIITYNHERYVRHCLDSVLTQRTDFPFEVIVGDDCSQDRTREIIAEYAARWPGVVRPILHEQKVGGNLNLLHVYAAARGEFLAHCDGDDAMLPGRLQKQVDFLRAHPECAFVAHKVRVISEDGSKVLGTSPTRDKPEISTLEQLIRSYVFFVHSSKMVRRAVHFHHRRAPDCAETIDFRLYVENATQGSIGFINEVLGEYRRGVTGSMSAPGRLDRLYYVLDSTVNAFDRALELGVPPRIVERGRARYLIGAAVHCASLGDRAGMIKYLARCRGSVRDGGVQALAGAFLSRFPAIADAVFKVRLGLRAARARLASARTGA